MSSNSTAKWDADVLRPKPPCHEGDYYGMCMCSGIKTKAKCTKKMSRYYLEVQCPRYIRGLLSKEPHTIVRDDLLDCDTLEEGFCNYHDYQCSAVADKWMVAIQGEAERIRREKEQAETKGIKKEEEE